VVQVIDCVAGDVVGDVAGDDMGAVVGSEEASETSAAIGCEAAAIPTKKVIASIAVMGRAVIAFPLARMG